MGDAVDGAVGGLSGQIIQQNDRGIVLREIVFQCQNLSSVPQRTLGQQPDFGQAIDHDTLGFQTFDGIEDTLDRFPQAPNRMSTTSSGVDRRRARSLAAPVRRSRP